MVFSMASYSYDSKDFIRRSFAPRIAVMHSPMVQDICSKNNLTFVDLLAPFCTIPEEINVQDPSGQKMSCKNFHISFLDINYKPPESIVARRLLNESAAAFSTDEIQDITPLQSGRVTLNIPTKVPWFENWRETFFRVQSASDHEFTSSFVACMFVTATSEKDVIESVAGMCQQFLHTLGVSPPKTTPKWFSSSILRYYVLLHDVSSNIDLKTTEKMYEELKLTYNANNCHALYVNSKRADGKRDDASVDHYWKDCCWHIYGNLDGNCDVEETGQEMKELPISNESMILHPLSPHADTNSFPSVKTRMNSESLKKATLLTPHDVKNVQTFVSNFVKSALIPFVETQMQYLNEVVSNKKGVSKSLFSATKRWFSGPKPGSPVIPHNTFYYHPDAPELQTRRLADLCFMFGAYSCAFQAYHTVKRDFSADGAWLHYAGALEMAALSAFLTGLDVKKALEYADEAVNIYLNTCRIQQFATRATLCTVECLKDLKMFGEAVTKLLLMTSEDSDLRSALLLEEASYCFAKCIKPPMPRKYAFHLVLAGHRYSKCGQKKHSLRCYKQAYQLYEGKNWSLAEDHIHFTIGRLARLLNQKELTVGEFAKLFLAPSRQSVTQQTTFLKDYLVALTELEGIKSLQVPRVDTRSIVVDLNKGVEVGENVPSDYVPATALRIQEEMWVKLEEAAVAVANAGKTPSLFKPTLSIFSGSSTNNQKPICVVGERIKISFDMVNILNIKLVLSNVSLQSDKGEECLSQCLDSVILEPQATIQVSLFVVPKVRGDLKITGVLYTVHCKGLENESVQVTGWQELQSNFSSERLNCLHLHAEEAAPCLTVYFKNLPYETFCGELRRVCVKLQNDGRCPVTRVLLSCSRRMFCGDFQTSGGGNRLVYSLLEEGASIQPNSATDAILYLHVPETSGSYEEGMLFYYEGGEAFQYRLTHHSLHLLARDSLSVKVDMVKSCQSRPHPQQEVNLKLALRNDNREKHPVEAEMLLSQISLASDRWMLSEILNTGDDSFLLKNNQVALLMVKARRRLKGGNYSDLTLGKERKIASWENPYGNFTEIFRETCSNNEEAILVLFWKAAVKKDVLSWTVAGQRHVYLKFPCDNDVDLRTNTQIKIPSLLKKDTLLVKLKHPSFVTHSFIECRCCIIPVEVIIQNWSDEDLDVRIEAAENVQRSQGGSGKYPNDDALFLWLGAISKCLKLEARGTTTTALSFCAASPGMYDLASEMVISAKSSNRDNCFIIQTPQSYSLLCISNSATEQFLLSTN